MNKNNSIAFGVTLVILAGIAFWYWHSKQSSTAIPNQKELVPQVQFQNNPIKEKVPEVNPLEKVNPFKYQNPLR